MNLLDGALDFVLLGRLGLGQQRFGQQCPLRLVLDRVHRVASLAEAERLQRREDAQMLKPRGLLCQSPCGQPARLLELRIVDGQRPQQHPLDFGQRRRPRLNVVAPAQRGLA